MDIIEMIIENDFDFVPHNDFIIAMHKATNKIIEIGQDQDQAKHRLEYRLLNHAHEEANIINVYAVTRHYGGSEEGGWWYNNYEFIEHHSFDNVIKAELAIDDLEEKWSKQNEGDINSVLGGVEYVVCREYKIGETETKETPTYS